MGKSKNKVGDSWDGLSSKTSNVLNSIKGYVQRNWDSISSILEGVFRPINSVIRFFENLYNTISRIMGNIVSTITNAWNRAGGILNKLNPFSSFSFSMPFSADTASFASPTSFASIAPMSADMPALARGFAPMTSFASTGGSIGDAITK